MTGRAWLVHHNGIQILIHPMAFSQGAVMDSLEQICFSASVFPEKNIDFLMRKQAQLLIIPEMIQLDSLNNHVFTSSRENSASVLAALSCRKSGNFTEKPGQAESDKCNLLRKGA